MSYPGNQVTDPPVQRRRRVPGLRGHDPAQLTLEDEEHYAFISAIGGGSGSGAPDDDASAQGGGQDRQARDASLPSRDGRTRAPSTPPAAVGYVPRARSEPAPDDPDGRPASGQQRGRHASGDIWPAARAQQPPGRGPLDDATRFGLASADKLPAPSGGHATGGLPAPPAQRVPGPLPALPAQRDAGHLSAPPSHLDAGHGPSGQESASHPPAPPGRRAAAGHSPVTPDAPAAAGRPGPSGRLAAGGGQLSSGRPLRRARRGPASGYPPMPGEPGPWYSDPQFSAWNPATGPRDADPHPLPLPAPAWAGDGDALTATAGPEPGGGGLALAERAGEDLARRAGDGAGLRGDREARGDAGRAADSLAGLSGDSLNAWPGSPAGREAPDGDGGAGAAVTAPDDEAAAPPDPTVVTGDPTVVTSPGDRTRATAAKTRKAARQKGRVRRRVVVAGICLPVIAVAAAMAYVHRPGHHAPTSPDPHARPAAASAGHPSPSLGRWQHIGTRATDPAPLTLSQLFPVQFTVGKASYIRTAQLASTNCPRAVFGAKLQAAVHKDGCSQVMRASYLGAPQKLMGTIGVLNLSDSAGAGRVGQVTGSSQFIAQLTGTSGPTHRLTKGTGLEEAEVKGHYLILTWVEFTTLRAPRTASERAQLRTFSADLISGTANVSLTSRMVTGRPQVP